MLNVNPLLNDEFNLLLVVCPSGGLFRGTNATVCWSCAAGGVLGSEGTLSSTEDRGVLLSEREGVQGLWFRYFGGWRWILRPEVIQIQG